MKDYDYLRSNAFERYVRQMVLSLLRLKNNIIFKQEHPCACPRTDGLTIWYDPCPDMYYSYVEKHDLPIETLVMCVMGDVLHEGLHGKYTFCEIMPAIVKSDYRKAGISQKVMLLMKLKVLDFVKDMSMPQRMAIKELFNIVEDSAIEYRGKQLNRYIANCLTQSNAITFATHIPFSNELVEKGAKDYDLLLHATMNYAIIGSTKGSLPEHLQATFKKIIPLVKNGKVAKDSFERFEVTKQIWSILKPYFVEVEEEMKERKKKRDEMYPKNDNQSKIGQNAQNNGFGSGMELSQETIELANQMLEDELNGMSMEEMKEKYTIHISNNDQNESDGKEESISSKGIDTTSEEKIPSIENEEEELLAGMSKDELRQALAEMKTSMSKSNKEFQQEQKEDKDALDEEISNMSMKLDYPNSLHRNVRVNTKVEYVNEYDKNAYNKIVNENHSLINAFVKGVQTLLHNRRDKVYYSKRGKLAQEKLYKVSFSQRTYKKIIEADKPDEIAIVVLVDESGSCGGERLENAKKACVVLTEACEKLNIPIAIVAHNASYPDFYLYHFKRFNGKKDKYSIPFMTTNHCNRDGLALLYAGEMLKKRPEPIKLLISITDGQPSDKGYSGDTAKEDMLKIGKDMARKGIILTGVAISGYEEGNEQIAKCYKNCVSCLEIKELSKHLLKILKPLL